jgi:hypothetical protein
MRVQNSKTGGRAGRRAGGQAVGLAGCLAGGQVRTDRNTGFKGLEMIIMTRIIFVECSFQLVLLFLLFRLVKLQDRGPSVDTPVDPMHMHNTSSLNPGSQHLVSGKHPCSHV